MFTADLQASESTGLSQGMATMDVSAPPGLSQDMLVQDPMSHLRVPLEDLQKFFESESLHHFAYVQAAAANDPRVVRAAVALPGRMRDLHVLLAKQGYHLDAQDHWSVLGMAPLCGPEPTEMDIASRARTAKLLLSLADDDSWSDSERSVAAQAQAAITDAASRCEQGLSEMKRMRRQFRPDKLPRWTELGNDAMAAVTACPHAGSCTFMTQWSQVLDPLGQHTDTVKRHRQLADLLGKGDAKFLAAVKGLT